MWMYFCTYYIHISYLIAISPDFLTETKTAIVNETNAKVIFCDTEARVKEYLAMESQFNNYPIIIHSTSETIKSTERIKVYKFDDFLRYSDKYDSSKLDRVIRGIDSGQCAEIVYTSGATGVPKGVMLSHDNITWVSRTFRSYVQSDQYYESNNLSTLLVSPLSHVSIQILQVFVPMLTGMVIYLINNELNIENIINALLMVTPTFLVGFPWIYEGLFDLYKRYNMGLSVYIIFLLLLSYMYSHI